jgi:5-amino-6-(5-phosphoribosylamino)uracil reductase
VNNAPLFVTASVAMSLDGYINDCKPERLMLSSTEDYAEVYRLRSRHEAILVGASTIRSDNPSLLAQPESASPVKVTITASGDLNPQAHFFQRGAVSKLVYTLPESALTLQEKLSSLAEVIALAELSPKAICKDLAQRGFQSLLIEGGSTIIHQFLSEDCVDRLRLALAPFFVGDAQAPQAFLPGAYPWNTKHRLSLASVTSLGDTVVAYYTRQHQP